MRFAKYLLLGLLLSISTPISRAEPDDVITDLAFTSDSLITRPFDEIRACETLSLDDLVDKDRKAALSRIHELPHLTVMKLYGCDFLHVDEKDSILTKVKTVVFSGGKISQGTIRWLAKFPAGTSLVIGSCDVRGLDFDLGHFKWLTFENCDMSRSTIAKLVETMMQVTFKEIQLDKDK